MHKKISRKVSVEAKHRVGLVDTYLDCFVAWMQERGYSGINSLPKVQKTPTFKAPFSIPLKITSKAKILLFS